MQTYTCPQIWAGIECTINRVGDEYHRQLERNGHIARLDDLDKFAALGIKTIRYPILWEQIAPGKPEDADWSWADERLERLRSLGICPIVGFVHHGSGPRHTSLIDPEFPAKLAEYAAAFAERYPWVEYYTPVNEPLTTARFSGLYGHWYPHGRDNATFATALINQCKAVILCMQAIRRKIPDAKLVQTEDLCKIHSTPLLAYQADFENERRWLSLDLLCGQLTREMWNELLSYDVAEETLMWFVANACPPAILGINHYVTSNRFLDEDLSLYPAHCHGGNSRHRYADVEAVRVPCVEPFALYDLLQEVWSRYKLPLAVTEVHLGGHREEQLRWLKECWDTARLLYQQQVDIRAITVWSLLGSFDWNSLVTRNDNFYESGTFDIRGDIMRPTALSKMISCLSANKPFEHPVLNMPGFWKREDRFSMQHRKAMELVLADNDADDAIDATCFNVAPILIIGTENALAQSFAIHCKSRAIHYLSVSRQEANITDAEYLMRLIEKYNPWTIIVTTEYTAVNDRPGFKENITGHINLAGICRLKDIQLLIFSSAQVFDGNTTTPYLESNEVCPVNINGYSKAVIEKKVLEIMPQALVIRTSMLFDNSDERGFIMQAIRTVSAGKVFPASGNTYTSATYIPDLVNVCIDLLIDKEHGIRHLANDGALTWFQLAQAVVLSKGLDVSLVIDASTLHAKYEVLSSEKGVLLPSINDALFRYQSALSV
jgi:dTDP-4-dehydrorhamnose reductase